MHAKRRAGRLLLAGESADGAVKRYIPPAISPCFYCATAFRKWLLRNNTCGVFLFYHRYRRRRPEGGGRVRGGSTQAVCSGSYGVLGDF